MYYIKIPEADLYLTALEIAIERLTYSADDKNSIEKTMDGKTLDQTKRETALYEELIEEAKQKLYSEIELKFE